MLERSHPEPALSATPGYTNTGVLLRGTVLSRCNSARILDQQCAEIPALRDVLKTLPGRERQVLNLRLNGHSNDAISEKTHLDMAHVAGLIHRVVGKMNPEPR